MPRLNVRQLDRLAEGIKISRPSNGQRFSIEAQQSPYKEAEVKDGKVTLFKLDHTGKEAAFGVVFNANQRAVFQSKIKNAGTIQSTLLPDVTTIVEALEKGTTQDIGTAITVIGKIEPKAAEATVPALVQILLRRNEMPVSIRRSILCLLGKMGSSAKAAVPTLSKLLIDENGDLRWDLNSDEIVDALANIRTRDSIAVLERIALRDLGEWKGLTVEQSLQMRTRAVLGCIIDEALTLLTKEK